MATIESNSLIQYKNEDGNIHIIYPVTKAENVDGIEDINVTGNAGTATTLKMQDIPSGSDLDNFVTPGFYSSKNGTITSTILNKPVFNISGSVSFSMYVFYWYGNTVNDPICQLVVAGTTNKTNEIHIRTRYELVWGEWKKVICDSDLNTELEKYVKKSGGTMTGKLTLSGTPTANLHAATKQYVDTGLNEKADAQDLTSHTGNKNNPHGVTAAQVGAVPKSGGTMTGKLTLSGDPSSNLHAATKRYVDDGLGEKVDSQTMTAELAKKLDKSGGIMTGALTLSGDPTENLHAATKQYVDNNSSGSPIRHIQRGVVEVGRNPANVTLSGFSNTDKMIVLINGVNSGYNSATGVSTASGHIGVINSISKLEISQSNTASPVTTESNVSYQVIEFI